MNADILTNIALHIDADKAEQDYFMSLLQHKTLKRKALLLHAGDVAKTISFVVKGCLRMYNTDADGRQHIVLFAPENWWCTDLFSFHAKAPSTHEIEALEPTEVLQMSHQDLERLYAECPKFERFFRLLFQNGFIMYQNRIITELSLTAEQKYDAFKKLYPGLNQRIAQKEIAAYLGITPVFLSMLRKRGSSIN